MPDNLAIRGIKERDAEDTSADSRLSDAFGVALCLKKNVLRTETEFLRFDHSEDTAVTAERVVRRAIAGFELLNGGVGKPEVFGFFERNDFPASRPQSPINNPLSGKPFGSCGTGRGHRRPGTIMLHI